jgi:hypothetical protein
MSTPTYMGEIRHFFTPEDQEHMAGFNIDLSTYAGVRREAINIYFMTEPPNAQMPPDPARHWSVEQSQTFKAWIAAGYPMGVAAPAPAGVAEAAPAAVRVRKNVTSLSQQELDALATAFRGIMDREPTDPTSFFALAGIHGMPQQYCLHHVDPFSPWHRVYLKALEDQLRSIPGCEDVTLPYWDISTPLPDVLQQAPFASYTLPADIGGGYFPLTTSRYTPEQIAANFQRRGVLEDIATALAQSRWGAYNVGGFQKASMQAHDGGHDSIGPTMANQDIASYDPIFWFFHSNLDRLWLKWQQAVGATTLAGFKSTIDGDTEWLSPPVNALPPLDGTSDESIAYGIAYEEAQAVPADGLENKAGSVDADRRFTVARSSPVSVRVKGINRLAIPGTFAVNLLADGEEVASRAFFQPKTPATCATCATVPLVNIDFRVDAERILDRRLSVEIEAPGIAETGTTRFPLSRAGSPTINARLLLDQE